MAGAARQGARPEAAKAQSCSSGEVREERHWDVSKPPRRLLWGLVPMAVVCFLIGAALGLGVWFAPAIPVADALPISASQITVVDGDTIRVSGATRSVRLVGFNAPESHDPQCDRERDLGVRAARRLRELVGSSTLDLNKVACACPPGTEGTYGCNYGRACGRLTVNGEDVGRILIHEGLAVPSSRPDLPGEVPGA